LFYSNQELKDIEAHAKRLGVKTHTTLTAVDVILLTASSNILVYRECLKNIIPYPLSVQLQERLSQALAHRRTCEEMKCRCRSTWNVQAPGNDQVRFDMIFHIMIPGVEIITPIRDLKLSREQEIEIPENKGVEMNFAKAVYSINKGLWGTSVGGKETLSSLGMLPEEAWPTQVSKSGDPAGQIKF
jgi:argininosuccinate synthase